MVIAPRPQREYSRPSNGSSRGGARCALPLRLQQMSRHLGWARAHACCRAHTTTGTLLRHLPASTRYTRVARGVVTCSTAHAVRCCRWTQLERERLEWSHTPTWTKLPTDNLTDLVVPATGTAVALLPPTSPSEYTLRGGTSVAVSPRPLRSGEPAGELAESAGEELLGGGGTPESLSDTEPALNSAVGGAVQQWAGLYLGTLHDPDYMNESMLLLAHRQRRKREGCEGEVSHKQAMRFQSGAADMRSGAVAAAVSRSGISRRKPRMMRSARNRREQQLRTTSIQNLMHSERRFLTFLKGLLSIREVSVVITCICVLGRYGSAPPP